MNKNPADPGISAWRRAAPPHPGSVLRERVLAASGISIAQAARELGVTRKTLHRLLSGTAGITPEMATRLGRFCNVGGAYWLNLQQEFDLAHADRALGAALDRIPTHANLAENLTGRLGTSWVSATNQHGVANEALVMDPNPSHSCIAELMTNQRMPEVQKTRFWHEAGIQVAEHSAVLAQLAEGVIVTDAAGRITFVNDASARIHGVARLDVPPDAYGETYQLLTENGNIYPSTELPLARAVLQGETVTDAR